MVKTVFSPPDDFVSGSTRADVQLGMANKMVTFFGGPSPRADMMLAAANFAHKMHSIPRKALRCDVYCTVSAVVDQKHAFNILAKVLPGLRTSETYDAMVVLQDRLDSK